MLDDGKLSEGGTRRATTPASPPDLEQNVKGEVEAVGDVQLPNVGVHEEKTQQRLRLDRLPTDETKETSKGREKGGGSEVRET